MKASNRRFLLFSDGMIFPEFDDIAVPPEPNDEFGSGNDAQQPQVSSGYSSAEEILKSAEN